MDGNKPLIDYLELARKDKALLFLLLSLRRLCDSLTTAKEEQLCRSLRALPEREKVALSLALTQCTQAIEGRFLLQRPIRETPKA